MRTDMDKAPQSASLAVTALALLLCAGGCSGADDGARDGDDAQRELDLTHEPCDVESSSAQRTDVNGDGKADIVRVMSGGKEVCRSVDLNFDGRVDMYVFFDEAGAERRREADFDRDGRADEISILKGGAVVRKNRETNFDGKLDTWDFYESGRLVRRERDANGDGSVDQWWTFNNPVDPNCAIVSTDANQDGKPDPGTEVDLCAPEGGAPTATTAPPPAGTASAVAPPASVPTPPPPPPAPPPPPPPPAPATASMPTATATAAPATSAPKPAGP